METSCCIISRRSVNFIFTSSKKRRMFFTVFVALLLTVAADPPHYSFCPSVGSNTGTHYSLDGDGRITGVRTWEFLNVIYGIQLRFGDSWKTGAGNPIGHMQQFSLFEHEAIVQVSGKFSCYINWIVFVTSEGRSFFSGHPSGKSFNMYPEHQGAELHHLTGTVHGAVTGLSTHWANIHHCSQSGSEED